MPDFWRNTGCGLNSTEWHENAFGASSPLGFEQAPQVSISLMYLLLVPGIPLAVFCLWIWWFMRRLDKKSRRPFEDMPRPAGWSLQRRTNDLMEEALINAMAAMMAGGIFWAFAHTVTGTPWVILMIGLVACSIMLVRSARFLVRARNHRLGLVGEQVVGQILDGLSSDSIRVFHDLEIREPGGKPWNIDHVVLTPAGVFCIETKTRRKPRVESPNGQKGYTLIFDGQQLIFPHPMKPDRHGLEQARRNATWLAEKLTSWNGTPINVTPALVFPGWWVEAKGKGEVAVLNHKQLRAFLNGRNTILPPDRQRAIAAQLDERCRIDLSLPA